MTDDDRSFAYWLGVSHCYGSDLCYWVLPESGIPITRTSVQHVTQERNLVIVHAVEEMKFKLDKRLSEENFHNQYDGEYFDDVEEGPERTEAMAYGDGTDPIVTLEGDQMIEEDDIDDDAYDKFIGAEVTIETEEGPTRATVKRRVTDYDGNLIRRAHKYPLLDTQMYELEYDDGKVDRFMANAIAENIYSQMDSEGRQSVIICEIIGHRKDQTVGEICLSVTVMVCITVMAVFFNERYCNGEHYGNGKQCRNGAECMSAKPTQGDPCDH
jgi:hypothetical protein